MPPSDPIPEEDNEAFVFFDSEPEAPALAESPPPWLILIVDDDPDVHAATQLALAHVRLGGRPCRLLHASSAQAARETIRQHDDIDLVLLDVVMETRDAGLRLVTQLREEDHRHDLRIVLRSGQPGWERESQIFRFPVDGYIPKARQTLELITRSLDDVLAHPPRHRAA